jgi:hypothetical protein
LISFRTLKNPEIELSHISSEDNSIEINLSIKCQYYFVDHSDLVNDIRQDSKYQMNSCNSFNIYLKRQQNLEQQNDEWTQIMYKELYDKFFNFTPLKILNRNNIEDDVNMYYISNLTITNLLPNESYSIKLKAVHYSNITLESNVLTIKTFEVVKRVTSIPSRIDSIHHIETKFMFSGLMCFIIVLFFLMISISVIRKRRKKNKLFLDLFGLKKNHFSYKTTKILEKLNVNELYSLSRPERYLH